ncbi:MAG: FAD-binding oxidoreductase [Anaerolineales bacterium]|nr:FAD-binding oxidoreductase [Anaerolineales bacterium]
MGEAHNIKGLWTALGSWLTHAGGVGKTIAEWMTHGETEWDMRQVHLHRFHDFQNTPTYLLRRAARITAKSGTPAIRASR